MPMLGPTGYFTTYTSSRKDSRADEPARQDTLKYLSRPEKSMGASLATFSPLLKIWAPIQRNECWTKPFEMQGALKTK